MAAPTLENVPAAAGSLKLLLETEQSLQGRLADARREARRIIDEARLADRRAEQSLDERVTAELARVRAEDETALAADLRRIAEERDAELARLERLSEARVQEIARVWREEQPKVEQSAATIIGRLQSIRSTGEAGGVPDTSALTRTVAEFASSFDARRGGFGGAPKFPRPSELLFLLREYARTGDTNARDMVLVWGAKQAHDFYALDDVTRLLGEAPKLRVILAVEVGEPPQLSERMSVVHGTVLDAVNADDGHLTL